jgi:hypothetical protein
LRGEGVADSLAQSAIAAGDDGDGAFEFHGFPPNWNTLMISKQLLPMERNAR